jgi:hypothetical protein
MKFLSFNCRGVESLKKKLALKRLILLNQPIAILLQETIFYEAFVTNMLEYILPSWKFLGNDATSRFGGLVAGWNTQYEIFLNSWALEFPGGGFNFGRHGEGIYGFKLVWVVCCVHSFLGVPPQEQPSQVREPHLGGDLNFSLGEVEVWGPSAHLDPQTNIFSHLLIYHGLIDIVPLKLLPT